MTQFISEQWLRAQSEGFDKLFGITTRCCDAFERLTALNLQAIRFGVAETQEAIARICAADNLPEMLCLPTFLAPMGFTQAQSYSRQFFEIMSDLQRDATAPLVGAVRQRHLADSVPGGLATQPLVPRDVPAEPALSSAPAACAAVQAATATAKRGKTPARKKAIPPIHTG